MVKSVALWGASGRLGSIVRDVIETTAGFELQVQLGSNSDKNADALADIVVDTSVHEASREIVFRAVTRGQKVLVGTSGWQPEEIAELEELTAKNPESAVLIVPNFSLGSVLETELARIAAPFFDAVEIVEIHHDKKIDSPSGTAANTARAIAEAKDTGELAYPFKEQKARGAEVAGIAIHSLRLPGILAKQDVRFGGSGETLTITHETISGDSYKTGIAVALKALPEMSGVTVGLAALLGVSK